MAAQPSFPTLLDAAHVRLAQLAAALRDARAAYPDEHELVTRLVAAVLDLRFGVENAARVPEGSLEQQRILGYLTETYGLSVTLTDPLLRSQLPPIPAEGATVVRRVLQAASGPYIVFPNGRLLLLSARLTAATPAPATP
ncbi:hypothetical protein [Hymenobacter glacieicola]|uniref:Type II secretion system protein GspE N-terminal domain-containing protein n=1 Tax=Hymenobacter glacieicola TaxID=1562124 RepID=A0ABQ1X829_9BACT|nr:hypothetical protein [Hymenobacter glacieicola]GGG60617.1 hypothetical protein GCM10011378_40780 [Hymenobacter glacieicola]